MNKTDCLPRAWHVGMSVSEKGSIPNEKDGERVSKILSLSEAWDEGGSHLGKHVFLGAQYLGILGTTVGPDGDSTGAFKRVLAPNPITVIADGLGITLYDAGRNRVPRSW